MATDLDLCFTTGTEAIQAFKAKKLSPVELMTAVINRCEKVNPKLNAITYRFFERARTKAKEALQRYLKSAGDVLPLEGLPVAIKDFHPVMQIVARPYDDLRCSVQRHLSKPLALRQAPKNLSEPLRVAGKNSRSARRVATPAHCSKSIYLGGVDDLFDVYPLVVGVCDFE